MKWYASIMSFLTGFLNLTPGAEEQDIHEELSTAFGKHATLADYRKAVKAEIRTEVETELNAAHTAATATLQASLDTANATVTSQAATITDLQGKVTKLEGEVATLKAQPAAERTGGKREEEGEAKKLSTLTQAALKNHVPTSGLPKW